MKDNSGRRSQRRDLREKDYRRRVRGEGIGKRCQGNISPREELMGNSKLAIGGSRIANIL
jgi:hypothetical protein